MAADGEVRVEREEDQDKDNPAIAEEEHQSSTVPSVTFADADGTKERVTMP